MSQPKHLTFSIGLGTDPAKTNDKPKAILKKDLADFSFTDLAPKKGDICDYEAFTLGEGQVQLKLHFKYMQFTLTLSEEQVHEFLILPSPEAFEAFFKSRRA
jgi:hypothetical protein